MEKYELILSRDIRRLQTREIHIVKFQWRNHLVEEATWEIESEI